MNLNELLQVQEKLDKAIITEKGLEGQDLFKKKIVALVCELYECVNEARFFKFWSENQGPRTKVRRSSRDFLGKPITKYHNPLLEEYVDTIHFALSIANDLGYKDHKFVKTSDRDLSDLVIGITNIATVLSMSKDHFHMNLLMDNIIQLGYQLGFTENQVKQAYYQKNKENHIRQETGY